MEAIEKKLQMLENKLTQLEKQIENQDSVHAISNLMGRYAFYLSSGMGSRIVDELWLHNDRIRVEYGASGVYTGLWKVKTYYIKNKIPGMLSTLTLSSPVINISEDGRKARGVWTAFGTETDAGDLGICVPGEKDSRRRLLSSVTKEGKRYRAEILVQKYDVTFERNDGQWKILGLHVKEFFRCPYDRDWVLFSRERFETDGMWLESLFESPMPLPESAHNENLPSGPTTCHWQYTTKSIPEDEPEFFPEN